MGAILSYSLYSSILLSLLYLCYKWVLSGEKQHAFNRVMLWLIYAIALLALPAINVCRKSAVSVDGAIIESIDLSVVDLSFVSASQPTWLTIVVWLYLVGGVAAILYTLLIGWRLRSVIASAEEVARFGHNVVLVTDNESVAPFSWCRYVVMNRRDWEENGEIILLHERQHLRLCHWVDLLIGQLVAVFQWYNPAAWLMCEEMKGVHEYQADDAVITSGISVRDYQILLIEKAVGARFPSLANSLNHSKLKKRITMMYNTKKSASRRLRGLALVPALGVALAVTNIDAVASVISETASASINFASDKVSENLSVQQVEEPTAVTSDNNDRLAEFPGGNDAMMTFLSENLQYPQSAKDAGINGMVMVQFVVEADGSVDQVKVVKSVHPDLDAEAVRVVKMFPKFSPGMSDGKPVAVNMALPINFAESPGISTISVTAQDGTKKFVIKGNESSNSTASSDYEYYVDGKLVSKEVVDALNPDQIKSMTVRKDCTPNQIIVTTK